MHVNADSKKFVHRRDSCAFATSLIMGQTFARAEIKASEESHAFAHAALNHLQQSFN